MEIDVSESFADARGRIPDDPDVLDLAALGKVFLHIVLFDGERQVPDEHPQALVALLRPIRRQVHADHKVVHGRAVQLDLVIITFRFF